MLNPGYYAVHRDAILNLGSKRTRLRKHDWLVTDGDSIGVFDPVFAMDWIPLDPSGRAALTDEMSVQVESAVTPVTFAQLERQLRRQLDTGDGAPIPDMPKAPLTALGPYLRSQRTLIAYTYQR